MRKLIRLSVVTAALLTVFLFCACSGKAGGAPEEKYGIRNSVTVRSDGGSVEYICVGEGTDEDTVFELGSNGKTVAAYVALKMADEGILDLDESIYPYLDEELKTTDPRMKDITLRQLLCHTAGFSPSYELGIDKKIYTDPGEQFRYSGVGYIYLQNVIENASGMTMDQAAANYVFGPLRMENSTFESTKTITPYMNAGNAVLYSMLIFVLSLIVLIIPAAVICKITKFKFRKAFVICYLAAGVINTVFLLFIFVSKVFVLFLIFFGIYGAALFMVKKHTKLFYLSVPLLTVAVFAAGFILPVSIPVTNDLIAKQANCAYSFRSTAHDMAIFCNELMERAKDPDDAMGSMFAPAVLIDDNNSWGLGVAIETENGSTTYWHSGINPGFQSLYLLEPEEDRYIVILTNSDFGLDYSIEEARSFLGSSWQWQIKR